MIAIEKAIAKLHEEETISWYELIMVFESIKERLDALEAQAHSHKATSDHETCIHRSNCKIYNTPCDYKPDTVQLASQSPAADLQNIPQGTLYVGDTERGFYDAPSDGSLDGSKKVVTECLCSNCRYEKYADEEEPCCSCKGLDKWQPRAEQLKGRADGLCPKCMKPIGATTLCPFCGKHFLPYDEGKPRAEQEDDRCDGAFCDDRCADLRARLEACEKERDEAIVQSMNYREEYLTYYKATEAADEQNINLRARLAESESIARENGELAIARKVEVERLTKENEELKRKEVK